MQDLNNTAYPIGHTIHSSNLYTNSYYLNPRNHGQVTTVATNILYWMFMGYATRSSTAANVNCYVTTSANTTGANVWAEFAIAKGPPVLRGFAALETLGTLSVTSILGSTGLLSGVSIPLTVTMNPGDPFWFGYGISSSIVFQLRGGQASQEQHGVFLSYASIGGPFSTRAQNITPGTIVATNSISPWIALTI